MKINLSEMHLKVLSLFTEGFDNEYYIREVQRILKISSKTAFNILSALEKQGILEAKTKGKIKIYKLQSHLQVKDYLVMVETYKKIIFCDKNPVINEILEKISPVTEGIGAVFGSYAKGLQKKGSDLDVFIAGKYNPNEINKLSKTYNIHISVQNYPLNIFEKEIKENVLLKEIIHNHIIFKGAEKFLRVIK